MRARLLAILALALPLLATTPAASAAPTPGDGWYLAVVSHGPRGEYGIRPEVQRLELVAPDGSRHRVLERPAGRWGGFQLLDWSADGGTALLIAGPPEGQHAIVVDVATGHTRSMRLPAGVASLVLAPDGSGLLATGYGRAGHLPLSTIAWDGTRTRLTDNIAGRVLASADGTTLLTNGPGPRPHVMRVLSAADGSVLDRIPVGGRCEPVRWWDARRALVTCDSQDLALVDPATGAFRTLTRRHNPRISDAGHVDARRIDSGLYVQVAGPCGYEFLGRKHRDGRVTKVDVPHAVGSVELLGGSGGRLVIEHVASCDGSAPRSMIGRFDPVTGRERVLVRLPRSEEFGGILAYGQRQPLED